MEAMTIVLQILALLYKEHFAHQKMKILNKCPCICDLKA